MKFNGFVGQTYAMDARTFDVQRCVNMYPIASEVGTSKSPSALRSIPGYTLFCTAGGGSIRGAKTASNGRGFVVSGYELYEIKTDKTATLKGTLLTGTTRVSMAENGTQLMIVDGTYGYIYNMDTDAFVQITDTDFPECSIVDFQDGFFIVNENGTANIYVSGIYDGLSWDVLDTDRADAFPDNLNSLITSNGNLWLFGENGIEVWQNTAKTNGTPFERITGAVIPVGCIAKHSVQEFDNSVVWLGRNEDGGRAVFKAAGYNTAQRISTQAIESKIADAVNVEFSYSYTYYEQGHLFYVLQVKGLDTTFVYDAATNMWHERQYYDDLLLEDTQHKGSCYFSFNGKSLIGDRANGNVYEQSLGVYNFNGEDIRRIRVAPHIQEEKQNIAYSNFELDMEVGVGNSDAENPQIYLKYSDDGGYTWSNEKLANVGALGKYKTRVRWARLGSARDRVFEVGYSEQTFFQINEAYINVY